MSVTIHTDLGDLKIEVYCEAVPKAAENFLALCASGYYDDTLIHRSIKGFIVQMGDPTGTGKGGTSIWGAPFEDEIRPALRHNARGVVSMANSGPDTNGSQFFVTYGSHPHLDGRNTVFGRVLVGGGEGEGETLGRLEALESDRKGRVKGREVRVRGVTVHANPLAE
ncbi:peptidyl-prolyl cis-trans isomerase-like 3 [Peziza echinospora]|nr:peptidyl-prolyl cis-trans isomerase-like 3 [Peziza echinospora]